jgi:hypothetical protein
MLAVIAHARRHRPAGVSALAQVPRKYTPNEYVTVFMVIDISAAAAGIYVGLVHADFLADRSKS